MLVRDCSVIGNQSQVSLIIKEKMEKFVRKLSRKYEKDISFPRSWNWSLENNYGTDLFDIIYNGPLGKRVKNYIWNNYGIKLSVNDMIEFNNIIRSLKGKTITFGVKFCSNFDEFNSYTLYIYQKENNFPLCYATAIIEDLRLIIFNTHGMNLGEVAKLLHKCSKRKYKYRFPVSYSYGHPPNLYVENRHSAILYDEEKVRHRYIIHAW